MDINVVLDAVLERASWATEGARSSFRRFRRGALGFPDFEDAVQAAGAVKVNADCIVTRNTRDFKKSPIACEPPGAVLAALRTATA